MHPAISQFPSQQFYDGKLENGVTKHDRTTFPLFGWVKPNFPVMFINVDGVEEKSVHNSKFNKSEILVIVEIIENLKQNSFDFENLGFYFYFYFYFLFFIFLFFIFSFIFFFIFIFYFLFLFYFLFFYFFIFIFILFLFLFCFFVFILFYFILFLLIFFFFL